ncbi:dTMP kinase [Chloroflexota bacterium]
MSLFITFEGGEGSGKSSQARLLYRRLSRLAIPVLLTHEPGVTSLGKKVTRLLKWAQNIDISPLSELMLFNASRAQLVAELIRPALKNGKVVICDRYDDSTIAYQGYGRGLDLTTVAEVNNDATLGLKPDLTILLDMPFDGGLARKEGERRDRFENEDRVFHQRVRQGYLELSAQEPGRWLVIDGSKNRKEIAGIIWDRVSKLLSI